MHWSMSPWLYWAGRQVLLACVVVGLIATFHVHAQEKVQQHIAFVPKGYELVWNDEFDDAELDLKKWQYRALGKCENAILAKESVKLDGKGSMQLVTFKKDDIIHTGMVGTQGLFQQKYCYFEARIKVERLEGHHGSFWLQSPTYGKILDNPGEAGAEIDIIEYFGSGRGDRGSAVNIYWNPYPKPARATPAKLDLDPILGKRTDATKPSKELCDDFHVFALRWTDKEYFFFIGGKEVYRTSAGLSHQPQFIVLSLLCSDWERPSLKDAKLPDAMVIDYVRVYAESKK
jgi:beta-glucanase (GH16 family)